MDADLIIIRYGELSLKSRYVRNQFELKLIHNIKYALTLENISCRIHREWGRIYLETDKIPESVQLLEKIFGITSVSPAIQTASNFDSITKACFQYTDSLLDSTKSFALRVTRTGTHSFTSQDVAIHVGAQIGEKTKARVDLKNPNVELFIEIRDKKAFIFFEKIRGPGGFPVGSQGCVLALLENTDSLLAAWFLLRRGCRVEFAVVNKALIQPLKDFCRTWYISPKYYIFEDSEQNISCFLNDLAAKDTYDAVVVGNKLKTAEELQKIQWLKKELNLPVLHPLISLDVENVQQQVKTPEVHA
ncbi:MAG: THUMP domain-containing protein [Candidatus Thermoplasmatota archaeon]